MKVRDPQGRTWRVTRRWVPWRLRRRKVDPDLLVGGDDPISCLVVFVVGLVVLPLLLIVVVFALEALLLALLLPVVALARVWFGRSWWVEARIGFRPHWEEEAGDWAASRLRIHALARSIENGDAPPANLYASPREGA
ncbi:hypothetical protein ABFU82_00250 [Nocardioides sp. WV_118_6]|uniref:hypothetical protein n=1 Tax=Pimelobacter TaxID=2044 RepID=UPI001C04C91B|nr:MULTISPECIES: hypothetical protein [Pimelobacter]UUW92344.1 hypothetical protein M0M43_12930 [Pimelobacter simplex]UUW96172.1 hypothetical protein M0M48_01565 [Pimelobacter simplex]